MHSRLFQVNLPFYSKQYKPCIFPYPRKKISVSIKNTGIRQLNDHTIYPKKDGILIPFSSAMERTMKFGAFPI